METHKRTTHDVLADVLLKLNEAETILESVDWNAVSWDENGEYVPHGQGSIKSGIRSAQKIIRVTIGLDDWSHGLPKK